MATVHNTIHLKVFTFKYLMFDEYLAKGGSLLERMARHPDVQNGKNGASSPILSPTSSETLY